MKLSDGRISISAESDGKYVTIELGDWAASIDFAFIKVPARQFIQALSRLKYTLCEIELRSLDKLGKVMEYKRFSVQMPDGIAPWSKSRREKARKLIEKKCPKGWKPDLSLSSQNTFYEEGGKDFVQTTIRRWVEKEPKKLGGKKKL